MFKKDDEKIDEFEKFVHAIMWAWDEYTGESRELTNRWTKTQYKEMYDDFGNKKKAKKE